MSATAAAPIAQTRPRLYFLDTLKVALTVLVVLHHVGQAYGPTGGFWYVDDPTNTPLLGPFFRINASFFMGLFFFISSYFLPATVDRKGAGTFLKDRLIRLGVPLLLFVPLIIPVIQWASWVYFRGGPIPFGEYFTQFYLGLGAQPAGWTGPAWPEVNFLHLWFILHLLVYAVLYAAWRTVWRRPAAAQPRRIAPPGDLALLGFAVAMAAVTYFTRMPYPIDKWIGLLGFIQVEPAHLPQYASMFVLGTVAYRHDWLQRLDSAVGRRWLWLGLGLTFLHTGLRLTGNWDMLPAFADVLWECLVCVGLSAGLIALFRDRFNCETGLTRWLAANAYGAYLFHIPVAVLVQYALLRLPAGGLGRFLVASALTLPLTFLLTAALRRLSGAAKVL